MVLDHVAQDAVRVKVAAAALGAEVLAERDLRGWERGRLAHSDPKINHCQEPIAKNP